MGNQQWVSLITPGSARATGAGTALTASASTATISPCQIAALTADAAQVNPDGQPYGFTSGLLIRVTARGYWSAGGTTSNATWLLRANPGQAAGGYVTLATTTAMTLGTTVTLNQWSLSALIRVTALGHSAGSLSTQGELHTTIANPANPFTIAGNAIMLPMPNTNGETVATVDTTQVCGIGLAATLSAAFGTIQLTQWAVEAMD